MLVSSAKRVFVIGLLMGLTLTVEAGIGSWLKNEVAPTLTGKRPLKIDPNKISITQGGKPILKYEGDSLYVKIGGVAVQTGHLRERIAEAGAIFSGDVAVMSRVAARQLSQVLEKAKSQGQVSVSNEPPVPGPSSLADNQTSECSARGVTIFNQMPVALRYALNGDAYEIGSGEGQRFCTRSEKYYLQFDDDPTENFHVARYFLSGNVYGLQISEDQQKINIVRHD